MNVPLDQPVRLKFPTFADAGMDLSVSVDTITQTATARSDGDKVIFTDVGRSGAITTGTVYYVVSKATNSFKVAATSGGAPIVIGTATVSLAIPADATTVTATVRISTDPDNPVTYTLAASQVVKDTTGVYHLDYTPPTAGDYAVHWKATGTVTTGSDLSFTVLAAYDAIVSVDDFALYLNNPELDRTRARYILDKAQTLCETIVKPLPVGADAVILDVAERAFANPAPAGGAANAYYAEGEGPFSDYSPGSTGGGLYLTKTNKATLRRLNGSGGAFTIDMTPADALTNLPWWDTNTVITTVSTS